MVGASRGDVMQVLTITLANVRAPITILRDPYISGTTSQTIMYLSAIRSNEYAPGETVIVYTSALTSVQLVRLLRSSPVTLRIAGEASFLRQNVFFVTIGD